MDVRGARVRRCRRGYGLPADERHLFKKLSLEVFQSGLSRRAILAKRENFRASCAGFDIPQVAHYVERDVERLLQVASIVRHRGKIEAVNCNAQCVETMLDREGALAAFVRCCEPDPAEPPDPQTVTTSPPRSPCPRTCASWAGSSSVRQPSSPSYRPGG
ncbi:hypothetical protein TNCT6_71230 [Streptomyces sp. 6-11-2]|nr:hypothetical protein TNCT6_71230 [Streptomyces sp. 6-11-2]